MRQLYSSLAVLVLVLCTGCASYTTPGPAADMRELGATPEMQEKHGDWGVTYHFDRKPLAAFPASIAAVRVQAGDYSSYTYQNDKKGASKFLVMTVREFEKDEHFERLAKLPMVRGLAPVNKMLFAGPMNSEEDLRRSAARVRADILVLYTLDTKFFVRDFSSPLTLVSLGLSPNQQARVTSTASAILLDTRSGYIYGLAESTAQSTQLTNAWSNNDAIDATRRRTEAESFDKLVGQIEKSWGGLVEQYAKPNRQARQ